MRAYLLAMAIGAAAAVALALYLAHTIAIPGR